MNPETAIETAERLFDYPEHEWDDLIETWCGHDKALKQEVKRIAGENRNARNFIEDLQNRISSLTGSISTTGAHIPEQIAGYKVLKKLGDGGTSTVYLVEMNGEKAALKLLRRGFEESEYARKRFEAEQKILASLSHPDIAQLIKGGVTEQGDLFVIMEYVDGVPIDVWCNRNRLEIEERIVLFQRVCRAVHYAHQNLVVHRDIKPDNILITKNGDVKLIDFGIAKLLEPDGADTELFHTRTGMHVMTPEFASPEQVCGKPITTASDIYSLGVLLYLLLSGQRPYEFRTASMLEIERIVCETEPAKPSETASSGAEQIAQLRNMDKARLSKHLKGDLDRIVLMAMWKDPTRRYASALSFADDLEAYLNGEPVDARTPTLRYRTRKFIARHRWAVAAAAVAFLSLTGGLAGTLWQAHIANQNAAHAELQAERAEQVAAFLAEMFEESDPTKAKDGSTTAREMLDRGFEKVQTELEEQPAVQAQMLGIIGKVYNNLGLYDQALPALEKSADQFRAIDESSTEYVSVLLELANLQYRLGRLDQAEVTTQDVLALKIQIYGPDHPEVASVMNTLAIIYEGKGMLKESIQTFRRVIDIRRQQPDPGSNLAANLNNLAILLHQTGELEESDILFREAVDIVQKIWGETHPYMAFTLNGYSGLHQQRGLYNLAENSLRKSLEIGREVFPETHPFIGVVLHNLGKLFQETKDYANAAEYYSSALTLRRTSLPPDHPDIASSLDGLAVTFIETGRPAEAEPLLREALEIRLNAYDEDDWRIAQVEAHLGRSLLHQNRYSDAEPLLIKSHASLRASRGDDDPHTFAAQQDLNSLRSASMSEVAN
ncbi:MAG: serine/threonine protein kinase [Balneolaceae bacterium]|nr:MAG: serine/threonine protein kinase [Balneolaceae bacterium]